MIGIYKITNPTGKIYIGQSVDIEKRIEKYKYPSIISKQPKIKRSLSKYGYDNHVFEIIEQCSINELDNREAFYKIKTINDIGWENVLFCKIWDCVSGKNMPITIKEKISKSNTGKKRTLEQKLKTSMSLINGKQCKSVYQYDLEGNFIKEWKYRKEAELYYNNTINNNISSCVNGKQKTAYGFQWFKVYKGEKVEQYLPHHNEIFQYDLNNNFIKKWNKISDAEKYYNPESFTNNKYGSNNIRACINGVQKTAYGFKWTIVNEGDDE